MNINNKILTNGLLSEFAYIKFENYEEFSKTNQDITHKNLQDLFKHGNMKEFESFLEAKNTEGNSYSGIDPSRQEAMLSLLKTHQILDFKSTDSGMQAMFLQEKSTGETKLLYRGTEFEASGAGYDDLVVADGEMAFGKATAQMQDARAYASDLKIYGVKNSEDKTIHLNTNTEVMGHSLGGSLSQVVGYEQGLETYAYNPFGIRRNAVMQEIPHGDERRIHSFHQGVDFVSGTGTAMGGDNFDNGFLAASKGRFIALEAANLSVGVYKNMTEDNEKSAHLGEVVVMAPFYQEDGAFKDHMMTGFNQSIETYATHLNTLFRTDDIQTLTDHVASFASLKDPNAPKAGISNIAYYCAKAIGKEPQEIMKMDFNNYKQVNALFEEVLKESQGQGVIDLSQYNKEELVAMAQDSNAVLYGIVHHTPMVVNNDHYAPYKETEAKNYSTEEIKDYVDAYMRKVHNTNSDTLYRDLKEELPKYANPHDIGKERVLFGTDKNDKISGMEKDDHLYGNSGNDTIHGDIAGLTQSNDHLEGGKGMDTLYGGKGDDTLIGGYGGGKDDHAVDVLYGGEGFDTYYVNDKDIISDSDNIGRIVFNGISLSGEKQKIEEHRYIDSHFNYDYSPEEKRLTVVDRATQAQITIEQFDPSSDALGIVLDASQIISKPKETQTQTPLSTSNTPFIKPLKEDETYAQVDLNRVTPITLSTLMANLPPSFVTQAEIDIQEGDVIYYKGKQEALVEKGDTLQDVLEYTKLNTPKLLAYNPWLISKERVSFPQGSNIIETPKENLSISDTLIYEEALADKIYANTVTEDELGIQREDEASQNQATQECEVSNHTDKTKFVPTSNTDAITDSEIQEPLDMQAKAQEMLQDLYPHLYQDKGDENEREEQDDMGMER